MSLDVELPLLCAPLIRGISQLIAKLGQIFGADGLQNAIRRSKVRHIPYKTRTRSASDLFRRERHAPLDSTMMRRGLWQQVGTHLCALTASSTPD